MKSPPPASASSSSSAPPPSYTETISSPTQTRLPLNPPTYTSSLRAPYILDLITRHILPHISDSALNGIASTTRILIPSNVSSLMHSDALDPDSKEKTAPFAFPGEKVVGFPDKDHITLVRLTGLDNKLEFWRQGSVVRELALQLRRALEAEGYFIVEHEREKELPPRNGPPTSPSLDVRSVEWKAAEQPMLKSGEARCAVEFREVTLRLENAMGLYETRSGMALVVKTEIGAVADEEEF
ncbi:MAG: hypothetical protein Q9195_002760 [Heterodermia aff. obscurata]